MPWHSMGYYRGQGYVLIALAVAAMTGLRMLWSSFTPVDDYTRRLRGDQPMWGRLLGILVGLLFLGVGAAGLAFILFGMPHRLL